MLLTNCVSVNTDKMEKVQIHPAHIVTGALQCTNTQRLYKETKWQTLKQRCDCHCICLFYKIVNGLTPSYLSSVLLERPAHGYNLRYSNDFPNILCRTNKYFDSFIPATISLWNGLDENVCQSETLEVFKNALNRHLSKPNPWFYNRPRKDAIHLTRFRLNCCNLNKDMFKFGLSVSNRCSCNTAVEDVFHFLFACPKYVVERDKLQTTVIQYAPFTMHTLLEGHDECSEEENRIIATSVRAYINETKRFST